MLITRHHAFRSKFHALKTLNGNLSDIVAVIVVGISAIIS